MADPNLSHFDDQGRARMVDVGDKPVTARRAVAEGQVRMSAALVQAIRDRALPKGDLLEVARVAGIQAAKLTSALIPMCHPLPLDWAQVQLTLEDDGVHIRSEIRVTARTGVEMEALTAVSVAALTVVDMGKAVDRSMTIEGIQVVEKSGGAHGNYRAGAAKP